MQPLTRFLIIASKSFFLSLLFLAVGSHALLAQGKQVVDAVKPDQMRVYLNEGDSKKVVEGVDGQPALQIRVNRQGENPWSTMHLSASNSIALKKGDILAFSIRMRVTGNQADVGDVSIYAESAVEEKKFNQGSRPYPTTELRTFRRSVVCGEDFQPGEAHLSVHFAAVWRQLFLPSDDN